MKLDILMRLQASFSTRLVLSHLEGEQGSGSHLSCGKSKRKSNKLNLSRSCEFSRFIMSNTCNVFHSFCGIKF